MADVFLSYAAEDRRIAQRLAETLGGQGWTIWWDRRIPPGLTFAEVIERQLAECQCAVVIWSVNSVGSQWVRTEANEALERRILVPIRLDDAKLPFEFRHLQAANFAGWTGEVDSLEFIAVTSRIQQLVQRHASLPAPDPPAHPESVAFPQTPRVADSPNFSPLLEWWARLRDQKGFLLAAAAVALAFASYETYRSFRTDQNANNPPASKPGDIEAPQTATPAPVAAGTRRSDTGRGRALSPPLPSPDVINRITPLQPAFFANGSAVLDAEARRVLAQNAVVLRLNPSWMITIEGHSDDLGSPEANLALGERRAVAAREYLVSAGIPAERLRTVSYGKEFPFDPSKTEQAQEKNRRAHFVLTAK